LVVVLVLVGVAALLVDRQVSQWCKSGCLPGDLQKPFDLAEVFGHGMGVGLLLITIWVLDPVRRWAIARLAVCAYGGGLAADLVKMLVARTRPRAFDFDQGILDSFGQFLQFGAGGSNLQSLPSAHVATAVGFALALGWLYPRGRFLFLIFAAMVAAQRVTACAHFCSDAFFGAGLGCLVAWLCIDIGPVARWFDRKEAQWRDAT
jgi:membrane-associated phospholipid phosphatase